MSRSFLPKCAQILPAKTGVKASVERRSTRRSLANAENSVCELCLVAEWHRRDVWSKVDFTEADRESLLYAASEPTQLSTPGTGRKPATLSTRRRILRAAMTIGRRTNSSPNEAEDRFE